MMEQVCQLGFDCPHQGFSEDGEILCIHPYTLDDVPKNELFGYPNECDCPLVQTESELEDWLMKRVKE